MPFQPLGHMLPSPRNHLSKTQSTSRHLLDSGVTIHKRISRKDKGIKTVVLSVRFRLPNHETKCLDFAQ